MALHETRFGWNLDESTDFGGNLAEVWTQKVHLEPGRKHTIMSVDMFIDALNVFVPGPDPTPARIRGHVILSPYPAWESAQVMEFGVAAPFASEPLVLYKASFEYQYDPVNSIFIPLGESTLAKLREFPTETISAGESFDFYSNQLYMTVFMTRDNEETIVSDCHISMLVQLDDKEVDEVEHFMGAYAEYCEAQRKRLLMESTLRTSTGANYSGYWFPSANFGGIRPENTVTGDLIGQFLTSGQNDPEIMRTRSGSFDSYQAIDRQARQMQAYNEAFGGTVPILGDELPDWLRFVRSEQFMMDERDVFPIRELDPTTMAVVML